MSIQNVKGTQDITGSLADQFSYVENVLKNIATLFNFNEVRPPVLEHTELFVRGVGESSDVVRKEMYTFKDKGDRELTLRPEFTAGIVRLFVQNKFYANVDYPVRYFYCGPVFRYERPQLGRYRQFNQFGVESLGSNSPFADVEVITLAYSMLTSLGLENVTLKINTLGDDTSRNAYREALKTYFAKHIDKMCDDCKSRYELNPLRILDCKVPEDQAIVAGAPKISDYLTNETKDKFNKVIEQLDALGIPYEIDDGLVRGLDYYSEVVFEFHYKSSKGQDYGAIGAGGHYDKLICEVGGPELPGVGFSLGVERVVSVLTDDGLLDDCKNELFAYVMPMGDENKIYAQDVTNDLRMSGYISEMCFDDVKFGAMFKRAIKKQAKFAIIIGDDERKSNKVTVKNLSNETQEVINKDQLVDYFDSLVAHHECECGCHHDDDCCCHEEDHCECGCHHDDDCECGCHDNKCCCHEEDHCECGCGCSHNACDCGHKPGDFPCKETGICPCGNDYTKCNCHVTGKCNCLLKGCKK